MTNEIFLLTGISACNFFRLNEIKYSSDFLARKKLYTTMICVIVFIFIIVSSVATNTYALIEVGQYSSVPTFVSVTISFIAFFLTLFRAGPTLFNYGSYEKFAVLPIRKISVIISRFLLLYIYTGIFVIPVGVTATVVCGILAESSLFFYTKMIIGTIVLPFIPISAAVAVGTVGYGVISKVKYKNAVNTLLNLGVIATVAVLMFCSNTVANSLEKELLPEKLTAVHKYYYIAKWFSDGINSNHVSFILFAGVSFLCMFATLCIVAKLYPKICTKIGETSTLRVKKFKEYKMQSPMFALYIREIKHYFSTSVYIFNTFPGFIFSAAFGVFILVVGTDGLENNADIPFWIILRIIPVIIGSACNIMPTTAASISLEGKSFWILQNLPLTTKDIVNVKLSLNMSFAIPSCILSSICATIAFHADFCETFFILAIPVSISFFGATVGLYMNLTNPMFQWESESLPVKQSRASVLTMFSLMLTEIFTAVILLFIPQKFLVFGNFSIFLLYVLGSFHMYGKLSEFNLKKVM